MLVGKVIFGISYWNPLYHWEALMKCVPGWRRICGAAKNHKKKFFKKFLNILLFKNNTVGVFLLVLQVYLKCQRWFWMSFLTYLNETSFFHYSIFGKDNFFNHLYVKSKLAFKTYSKSLGKLEELLKIRL